MRARWFRKAGKHGWPLAKLVYRSFGLTLEGQPDDLVWYFAYGSNLDATTFHTRRQMTPRRSMVASVRGYRLRFNLDGFPQGKAAPANIETDDRAELWGVLYELTRRELVRLDATEGVPGGAYRHVWVDAESTRGETVGALTYMAPGNPTDGKPSLRYINLLRDGARAHGLPAHWVARLDAVEPAE